MLWAPFLHIYQPPTQYLRILKKIAKESYAPLVELFERNPKARVTLNIPASLTEQLIEHGYSDLIQRLARLVEKGQIELTGCAAYHPLLTRLPEEEVERQVKLNEEINRRHFGVFKPRGFFPPEMAYSRRVGEIVSELGYDWILLEDCCAPEQPVRRNAIYQLLGRKLAIFFRHRDLSLAIAFGRTNTAAEFVKAAKKTLGKEDYLLLALDGETFGHHRKDALTLLNDLYSDRKVVNKVASAPYEEFESVTISELLYRYRKRVETDPMESTWAASHEDCLTGKIYPRWDNPKSPLHSKQWELWQLAIMAVGSSKHQAPSIKQIPSTKHQIANKKFGVWDLRFEISGRDGRRLTPEQRRWLKARRLLDLALHSDQFWWASHRPFWHPGMVRRGAGMLLKVVNTAPGVSREGRERAKKLYDEIVKGGVKLYGRKPIVR